MILCIKYTYMLFIFMKTTKTLTKLVKHCASFCSCYIRFDLMKITFKAFQRAFYKPAFIAKLPSCEKHLQRACELTFLAFQKLCVRIKGLHYVKSFALRNF